MKFTVLAIEEHQENESDYETAVEMSHSSVHELNVKLRADDGAVVLLQKTTVNTSFSSVEPDFYHLEESGETVYVREASERPNRTTTFTNGFLLVVPSLPMLSPDDWGVYHALKENEGWDRLESVPADQRQRLSDFHYFPALLGESDLVTPLPAKVLDSLLHVISDNLSEGQVVDISLSSDVEKMLVAAGHKTVLQEAANSQAHFENQVSENTWKAQQAIAETVKEARAQIGRGFKP